MEDAQKAGKVRRLLCGLRRRGGKKTQPGYPLKSIFAGVFSGEKYIEEKIKSVITQAGVNVECIIVVGSSEDGTFDVVRKSEDFVDYWVNKPDSGTYDGLAKGSCLFWVAL